MATADVVRQPARESLFKRLNVFYHEVVAEMKKVTWPDRPQLIDVTIKIIIFVLFVGAVIFLIDFILQKVLVQWLPALFTGR